MSPMVCNASTTLIRRVAIQITPLELAGSATPTSTLNAPSPMGRAPTTTAQSNPISSATRLSSARKETRVKFIIYFQSLIIETINQVPQYNPAGLISNMGGIVGVYLSFGFLVIYEILEICFRATYAAVDFKVLGRRVHQRAKQAQKSALTQAVHMKRQLRISGRNRTVEAQPKYFDVERREPDPPYRLTVWDYPSRIQRHHQRTEVAAIHQAPQLQVDLQNYIKMRDALERHHRRHPPRLVSHQYASVEDI
ncbi:hypothetical protein BIW11_04672 [Tropilaelaps mercedesae]|uniref:Uncharacterized protein n=1 Tax=Tropilaelaps mercedesae TaxID=418985 RepID=A0A1V9X3A8_9ACAR|nr:hypothetical protein BIW11_04672 [Tropilaelaps mercedesae]